MKYCIIGSGGREHALCSSIKNSNNTSKIYCIPGNAGTKEIAINIKGDISNFNLLYKIIKKNKIDIVIIGPEQPLVAGLADYLNEKKWGNIYIKFGN